METERQSPAASEEIQDPRLSTGMEARDFLADCLHQNPPLRRFVIAACPKLDFARRVTVPTSSIFAVSFQSIESRTCDIHSNAKPILRFIVCSKPAKYNQKAHNSAHCGASNNSGLR
jgi:hypothetical protein